MISGIKNWPEKSLALIRATFGSFRQLNLQFALEKAFYETCRSAESSEILLFSVENYNVISILKVTDSGFVRDLIDPGLFYETFYTEGIQVRKMYAENGFQTHISKNCSHILFIPLKEEFFNGHLALGFDTIPSDIDGLLEYGEIVQKLFLEIFYLESLRSGKFDTEKVFSALKGSNFDNSSFDSNQIKPNTLGNENNKPLETKAEIKTRQKDSLFDEILKNLPVLILRISGNGLLLEIGGKGLDKLDLNEDEHLGLKVYDLLPELDFPQLFNEINKGKRLVLKKYKAKIITVFDFHFFPHGINSGEIIGFGIDISDQYLLENRLKKAKKTAEKANLAKSFFLANQSHEIRTFVQSILGFAQLIKNNQWPEESEEYLNFIISSGQILLNILGNILDLTKIEEGKLELVEEPFDFMETMNSCLSPSQFQAKGKGLKFTVNFDKEFPKYFIGDSVKLIQIVVNLVSNSIKFTENGEIKISFSCLSNPVEGEKIKIGIAVSDSGIGISKTKQKKIFGNFSQADKSIHRRFGGSGLGLSIVKELVNLMGGKIEVRSPGDLSSKIGGIGSTFWLTINLLVTKPTSNDIDNDADKFDENLNDVLKVLLVDDNNLNQRLASIILKNLGCEVTMATNGKEAIRELKKNDYHLIFMDLQMPLLDGYQTTKTIRENLKLNLPIIGLSANVNKEDIELCYESGMDDYLGRPYTIKNFEEKVYKWAPQIELNKDLVQADDSYNNQFGKLIELNYLDKVFNGNLELMKDLVQSILFHHQIMVANLKNAISSKDYDLVASLAHDIRSSLQTIGLNSLIKVLIEIEINAREIKNDSELERQFLFVKETSEEASLELEKFLES